MSDLFDETMEEDDEELDEGVGSASFEDIDEKPKERDEPLFSTLMKRAVAKLDPHDTILQEFVSIVVPNISLLLADKTAKGGEFVQLMREQGKTAADVARYGDDQSMRAHLINGLLPVLRIAKTLRRWNILSVVEQFDDVTERLFLAGFTLHDWLKLPHVEEALKKDNLNHHTVSPSAHLTIVEKIIGEWCGLLGLDRFLQPLGSFETVMHHLIAIASNTQIRWGVMHNLSKLTNLSPRYRDQTNYATHLSTLADYLAYLGRTPVDAVEHESIKKVVRLVSNASAHLTYHHVADVRGVVTNLIHNATLDACRSPDREPLLYCPTGVVYLERSAANLCFPDVQTIVEATTNQIRETGGQALYNNLTGFARDGKGLKHASFYDLFFTPQEFATIIVRAAERKIPEKKKSAAPTRFEKMQTTGMIPPSAIIPTAVNNIAIDMLAEGVALLEKKLKQYRDGFDAQLWLLQQLGVPELNDHVTEIPQRGNTGGVPYQWYYAVGIVYERNQGREYCKWLEELQRIALNAATLLPNTQGATGWDDLGAYIRGHLRFWQQSPDEEQLCQQIKQELGNYTSARRTRQATRVCALCSSGYTISEQREAAVLFAPMVYSNKQALHGSKAMRNICAICEMEMMLRKLLMNRTNVSGQNFEKRKLRYLFFYPMYFFTPETLDMVNEAISTLKNFSITEMRNILLPKDEKLTAEHINHVLDPQRLQKIDEAFFYLKRAIRPEDDHWLRMHFSDQQPTFTFIGIPPVLDAKDAEAWVKPALLTLLMPLLLDVKVVASESMMPIINEANEIPETVLIDSPHAWIPYILKHTRLNYDQMVKSLQTLIAAYMIHLDGNSKTSAGFDYVWNRLPALARDLDTSPLYVFAYLKRWQRRAELDSISTTKATLYLRWFDYITQKPRNLSNTKQGENQVKTPPHADKQLKLDHAEKLVSLYRQFYRHAAGKRNSNSILKPISIAAATLLDADLRMFPSDDALVNAIKGNLLRLLDDIGERRGAEGKIPHWISGEERQTAVHDFAEYWVKTIYREAFDGDLAAMRGKQLNLLKGACEVVYLDQQTKDWNERQQSDDHSDSDEA